MKKTKKKRTITYKETQKCRSLNDYEFEGER